MFFEITSRLPGTLARTDIIHTAHGDIKTPTFLPVGTFGFVKFVEMDDLRKINAEAMLSNAYHLRRESYARGLADHNGWHGPTFTDSGGFQVMSLGSGLGKVVSMTREKPLENTAKKDRLAKVTEEGVHFTDPFDGTPSFIGPEESMQIQCKIGSDIHMAFDELTSLADDYDYTKTSLARTERWALRSLKEHEKHKMDLGYEQHLYAVLQGGHWEDLRRSTARFLSQHPFDGFGLGGAFLKEDLGAILRWCDEELPENKPRHLLGLSHPDDIFVGVENGADTFDCVAPTREARHGKIYTKKGNINLRKFADSAEPLDEDCDCPTCKQGCTRGQLRALWRSGDLEKKQQYYNLASVHNLRFILKLTEDIRTSIDSGTFFDFKRKFLDNYQNRVNI